ncbi:L-histidine N(alpha)-methyltransferase [Ferrimonas balearica]|uniref:L-histidine N(alpha)-methyltransferase n=1 Tax=Ferrimonas balearica TaxID=44012 RepID=UPI001C98EB1A|nr:L-histidine N(alpha)-methyltransferase [Ferrimonas balearica]MBY5993639.1 L-histidine N(alpha)-methyltransferase [Ferrimonas balearica]
MPASNPSPRPAPQLDPERQALYEGLLRPQKQVDAKYFYDAAGAALFERICALDEYYPYRTELAMLPAIARALSEALPGPMEVVEFGAGALVKAALLLEAMPQIRRFYPIDIAGEPLRAAAGALQARYPRVQVQPIEADFTQDVVLPESQGRRMVFFPGSTIGNFAPRAAVALLQRWRRALGPHSYLLIGVDTKKCPHLLHRAYNDAAGVTARFNRNMVVHLNRRFGLGAEPDAFDHYAFYHPGRGRIEMHLVSRRPQQLQLGPHRIALAEGESLHTENSYKYTPEEFHRLAAQAGWHHQRHWLAPQRRFAVTLLRGTATTG